MASCDLFTLFMLAATTILAYWVGYRNGAVAGERDQHSSLQSPTCNRE